MLSRLEDLQVLGAGGMAGVTQGHLMKWDKKQLKSASQHATQLTSANPNRHHDSADVMTLAHRRHRTLSPVAESTSGDVTPQKSCDSNSTVSDDVIDYSRATCRRHDASPSTPRDVIESEDDVHSSANSDVSIDVASDA